ncbi:MAG: tRNA (guanosine(37)-N1)-methyltransferase TrmD [Eggerthellaceae bacterium]|nr:tRNA (guanosine(37)-N1)-methyltransferase TrmD [Eggerthellaceae bacterium]
MIIETLSTFPEMFDAVMSASIMKRAQEKGYLDFCAYNLRRWTHDKHRTTDDDPYGGGSGLVMKCEPIFEAYDALIGKSDSAKDDEFVPPKFADSSIKPHVVFLAPFGKKFDDKCALELSKQERLLFVCGHYEGIDERAFALADEIVSIGDYVLTSGELAAMVVIDAVVRKIPGVLGADDGALLESFADGLLEYPQYTRPASYRGMDIPEVLVCGDHAKVDEWRRFQQLKRTLAMRPDLLESAHLSDADLRYLVSLGKEEQ